MSDENYMLPIEILKKVSNDWNLNLNSFEFALKLDESNIWPTYRDKFVYPKLRDLPKVNLSLIEEPDNDCIYFCGNSLGLLPKITRERIIEEVDKWGKIGLYAHHFCGQKDWTPCDKPCHALMSKLVGAKIEEVNVINFLTVNLHLLMVSFYAPTKERYKILIEEKAFPSDHYAVESQIRLHNLEPVECIVYVKPRPGEFCIRNEDIIQRIEEEGSSIALVVLSGIQYYTGQLFKIKQITEAAHKQGCLVGWDLAHAVGNVELKLHEWNVDFAVWCTYKYLNSGAGGIGAVFLHERHFNIENRKKLDGWWSHKLETRFQMSNSMEYATGAAAYAISCPSMLLCSSLIGSLELFDEVGMTNLREKSKLLTAYLEELLSKMLQETTNGITYELLTPTDPDARGSQLSVKFSINIETVHEELEKRGIVCDYRYPSVLRFSPVPLYNTFTDIFKFIRILKSIFNS